MDQSTRIPRRPTARFSVLRRRPAISGPIGPVIKNSLPTGFEQNEPMHHKQDNARKSSQGVVGRASERRSVLARPSSNVTTSPCPVVKVEQKEKGERPFTPAIKQQEESIFHWRLPKSRTLSNVFSGITHSFSRSSLAPSRRENNDSSAASISGASDANITTATTAPQIPPINRFPISKSSRWSLGSSKSQIELSLSRDPYFIYESQPSAYWTGRFVSLHDKFQSEALTPNNMHSVILAHSARNKDMTTQRNRQSIPLDPRYTRYNTRLPPSATSAAILQQTGGNMADAIAQADVALLLDEDERCKRVFVHLEAFCATDEARASLRLWQQDYARKTGRKKLLPKGGAMQDRQSGSYISRIMGAKRIGKRASIM